MPNDEVERDEESNAPFAELESVDFGEETNAAKDHDVIPGTDRSR